MTTPHILTHVLRKDLRHVRLLFSVWLLLLLAQSALVGSGFGADPDNFSLQAVYSLVTMLLPLLQGLVVVVLVPLLIQDEPLVGSTAFWFTRPLSRGQLLSAKALFVAAFLVLPPLLLEALVFTANGIRAADTVQAVIEVLFQSLGSVLALAALAALTRTFAKFVLWLAVAFVTMVAFSAGVQIWGLMTNPDALTSLAQEPSLAASRSIVSGSISIAGCLAVVVHQYLTRRTRLSLIMLIATIVASAVTQAVWNRDFLRQPEAPASAATIPPGSVRLSLKSGQSTSDVLRFAPGGLRETEIRATIDVKDVPEGIQLSAHWVRSKFSFSDNSPPLLSIVDRENISFTDPWWPSVLSHAIGGVPVLNSQNGDGWFFARIFRLPTDVYQERKHTPGLLECELELQAAKLDVLGRLPLEKGARITRGSRSFEIATILQRTRSAQIILRERRVNLWGSRPRGPETAMSRTVFLLVNRTRNEAVLPDRQLGGAASFPITFGAAQRLLNQPLPLEFSGALRDKPVVTIDEDWLRDAELVVLQPSTLGTLERSLTKSDFQLSPGR